MTAKQIHVTRVPNGYRIVGADDYLHHADLALEYTKRRWQDAEWLLSMIIFKGHLTGTRRAEIHGHSIVWDIAGGLNGPRHTGLFEMLPRGEDDPVSYLQMHQVLAYILARNW